MASIVQPASQGASAWEAIVRPAAVAPPAAPAEAPPRGPSGGFRLDDRAAALKGGKAGNDILPGKAEDSLLVKLLVGPVTVGDHEIAQMPKGQRDQKPKPFTPEQIELVKRWINQGAKWE